MFGGRFPSSFPIILWFSIWSLLSRFWWMFLAILVLNGVLQSPNSWILSNKCSYAYFFTINHYILPYGLHLPSKGSSYLLLFFAIWYKDFLTSWWRLLGFLGSCLAINRYYLVIRYYLLILNFIILVRFLLPLRILVRSSVIRRLYFFGIATWIFLG